MLTNHLTDCRPFIPNGIFMAYFSGGPRTFVCVVVLVWVLRASFSCSTFQVLGLQACWHDHASQGIPIPVDLDELARLPNVRKTRPREKNYSLEWRDSVGAQRQRAASISRSRANSECDLG